MFLSSTFSTQERKQLVHVSLTSSTREQNSNEPIFLSPISTQEQNHNEPIFLSHTSSIQERTHNAFIFQPLLLRSKITTNPCLSHSLPLLRKNSTHPCVSHPYSLLRKELSRHVSLSHSFLQDNIVPYSTTSLIQSTKLKPITKNIFVPISVLLFVLQQPCKTLRVFDSKHYR